MKRKVPEWIGKTPDTAIPPRVKLRVFDKYEGKCYKTGVKLRAGEYDFDHRVALCNGGENRESNLAPIWREKHREKTRDDLKQKTKTDRIRKKFLGLDTKKEKPQFYRGVGGQVMDRTTGRPKTP